MKLSLLGAALLLFATTNNAIAGGTRALYLNLLPDYYGGHACMTNQYPKMSYLALRFNGHQVYCLVIGRLHPAVNKVARAHHEKIDILVLRDIGEELGAPDETAFTLDAIVLLYTAQQVRAATQ